MLPDCPMAGRLAGLSRAQGQSPVHHQHLAIVTEHHVLRLQIPVNDAARMSEAYGVGHLHQDLKILGQRLPFHHAHPGRPLNALHRIEERPILIRAQVVNGNDVWMVEVAGDLRLTQEFVALVAFAGVGWPKHLDRNRAVDRRLPRCINDTHAAFTNYLA